MGRLLSGIRVIESGSLLSADSVGMLLGDWGADVIKLERPNAGDYLRDIMGQILPGHSPAHLQFNRNKRSVTADLTSEGGREVFLRLAKQADVFVDGNMPGMLSALRLGYDELRALNPGLIYCASTGYGATGPYSTVPTHSLMMNALVGCVAVEMGEDGFMHTQQRSALGGFEGGGSGPVAAAPHAAFLIASALLRRTRTGEGCYIDIAASDCVVMGALTSAVFDLNEHRLQSRAGIAAVSDGQMTGAKYQFYQTRDGKALVFGCVEMRFWERFCVAVGRKDLIAKETSGQQLDYADDAPALRHELQSIIGTRDLHEWMQFAAEYRVPIGPVPRGIVKASEDEQIRSREIIVEGTHPAAGAFTYVGSPARVDGSHFAVRLPAPSLGENSREVLREVGYSEAEIEKLARDRAI